MVTAKVLRAMRRYAIVGLTAVAAIFTPPDPYSMLSLMLPLVALYEISIICVMSTGRVPRQKNTSLRPARSSSIKPPPKP